MDNTPKRPDPETEEMLDYCPKCGSEIETCAEDDEWMEAYRACPEHGRVTIDFQDKGRGRGYSDGAIHSQYWVRCPSCAYLGVEIPAPADWENVYFECPECGQEGIV